MLPAATGWSTRSRAPGQGSAPARWAKDGTAPEGADLTPLLERLRGDAGRARIRCPRCAWRPRASDRWSCRCGCSWNTFETRGRCPECQHQWRFTQCLSCHRFSLHEDWYPRDPQAS